MCARLTLSSGPCAVELAADLQANIAALVAVLLLYTDPKSQVKKIPALRLMARTKREISCLSLRICDKSVEQSRLTNIR